MATGYFNPTGTMSAGRWILTTTTLTVLGFAIILGLIYSKFDSTSSAIAYFEGMSLSIDRSEKSFGVAQAGGILKVSFHVTNNAVRPIKLVGGFSTCGCTLATGLPRTLVPGEEVALDVVIRTLGKSGAFKETVRCATDDLRQPFVNLTVTGKINPPAVSQTQSPDDSPELTPVEH